ncbi:MAG: hypothetical protein QNJ54_05030 [Prochloraceae cyanobacterium]|nr:hypothetical protein [Prochloraceae cyanobacterium]
MNAAEQARGLNVSTKIAALINLFKSEFPDAKADLKPWRNDPETLSWVDPDSIDIGFHFPGWSRRINCHSILVQIRFYQDPLDAKKRLIGIETAGFSHQGQAWRLSTVENWQFFGSYQPAIEPKEQIKHFCRNVFELFDRSL